MFFILLFWNKSGNASFTDSAKLLVEHICYIVASGKTMVRVTRPLVFLSCFVDRCLSVCPFSFDHCVVCPSIYGF